MDAVIMPAALSGTIQSIPSKSHVLRLLICSALSFGGTVSIDLRSTSDDIEAAISCLKMLGSDIAYVGNRVDISPILTRKDDAFLLNCGESASVLRFLLPVTAALGITASFTGSGRLPLRPLEPLLTLMRKHGVTISGDFLPFTISGKLNGGTFLLPGDISSQYVTGLMLALPLAGGGEIYMTSPLQSKSYADMTAGIMNDFGIPVTCGDNFYSVPEGNYTMPSSIPVQGDWSNSAVWLCAGVAGSGSITVTGLSPFGTQGDSAITDILRSFGATVSAVKNTVTAMPGRLSGITIDASQIPDLIPPLSVVAAAAEGETRIINAARLRLKESDRLEAIFSMLQAFGCSITISDDSLIIHGGKKFRSGVVPCFNDHRIIMSAAIAASMADGPVTLTDCQAVGKSYPAFFNDFRKLGGIINV